MLPVRSGRPSLPFVRRLLADIRGGHLVIRNAVMNAHPLPANATYDPALEKRRAFACRPGFPCSSKAQRVFGETLLIGLKLVPGDVADMSPRNDQLPLQPGNLRRA